MTNLTGTASRTDKTLIESGRFYPKGTKIAEARLREANFVPLSPLSFLERSASVYPGHIALIYATRRQTCFACVNSGALPTGAFGPKPVGRLQDLFPCQQQLSHFLQSFLEAARDHA